MILDSQFSLDSWSSLKEAQVHGDKLELFSKLTVSRCEFKLKASSDGEDCFAKQIVLDIAAPLPKNNRPDL